MREYQEKGAGEKNPQPLSLGKPRGQTALAVPIRTAAQCSGAFNGIISWGDYDVASQRYCSDYNQHAMMVATETAPLS